MSIYGNNELLNRFYFKRIVSCFSNKYAYYKGLFVFLLTGLINVCNAQTPPHYYHNPPNCGVNNLFFNIGVCNKFQFIYTQTGIVCHGFVTLIK